MTMLLPPYVLTEMSLIHLLFPQYTLNPHDNLQRPQLYQFRWGQATGLLYLPPLVSLQVRSRVGGVC